MTEEIKTISEARQSLTKLSQAAQSRMARVLITNQGKPQSVLLGYDDYRGMVAANELASRPEEAQKIRERLALRGKPEHWLTFDQLKDLLERRRAEAEMHHPQAEAV